MKSKHLLLLCVLPLLFSALPAGAQTLFYPNRTVFSAAAPQATNTFGFEEFNLAPGTSTGFFSTLTELGYVTFNSNGNYRQEVIDGFNVGQPNNNVYVTIASLKTGTLADITFGAGVSAVGFDLKNTASAGSTAGAVPQEFTISLFSGSATLGSFAVLTLPGGSLFSFAGFTSDSPITQLTITSTGLSPNLDVVLDNFQVSAPVPEPGTTALALLGAVGVFLFARRQAAASRR